MEPACGNGNFLVEVLRRKLAVVDRRYKESQVKWEKTIFGSFNSEKECLNLLSYLKTKFTRFLVSQLSFSQDITKDRFAFVPIENSLESWTDEKLYAKYGLSEDEIAFIDSMIRPMKISKNVEVDE